MENHMVERILVPVDGSHTSNLVLLVRVKADAAATG
jgi:hypothetical protein